VVSPITAGPVLNVVDDPFLAPVAASLPVPPLAVLPPFLKCAAANVFRRQGELRDRGLLSALTPRQ
jgi:hypothetical protein